MHFLIIFLHMIEAAFTQHESQLVIFHPVSYLSKSLQTIYLTNRGCAYESEGRIGPFLHKETEPQVWTDLP